MQMQNLRSRDVRDKEMVGRLIAEIMSAAPPREARMVCASLAAAASDLPAILQELEDMLQVYESVPWEDLGGSTLPTHLPATGRNIIGMLSTWTVLCCRPIPLLASHTFCRASFITTLT
jgi:hypothetical protein